MKKKYNFLFTIFHDERECHRTFNLAAYIYRTGQSAAVVTNLTKIDKKFENSIQNIPIFLIEDNLTHSDVEICFFEKKIKSKFHIPDSFYKLCETEFLQNNLMYKNRNEVVQKAISIFLYYEKLLKKYTFDYFVQLFADDLHRAIFAKVGAKYAKRELIQFTESPFPDRPLFLFNDFPHSKILKKELRKNQVSQNKLITKVKKIICEKKIKNLYLAPQIVSRFNLNYFSSNKQRILKTKITKQIKKNFYSKPLQVLKSKIISYCELKNISNPFVFYPLHAPLESQTIVRGFAFRNEFSLLELISLSLPINYNLCVKEHPGFQGYYPYNNYLQLKKYENIKLLNPSENSHEIIKKATLIILINSTVWFESLLFNKPVIALGTGIFSSQKILYECSQIEKLPAVIAKATFSNPNMQKAGIKFIYAYWKSCFPIKYRAGLNDLSTHNKIALAVKKYSTYGNK